MTEVTIWTMPVSTGIVCLWAVQDPTVRSVDFDSTELGVETVHRQRVLVSGVVVHLAICRSPSLNDGRACRVRVEAGKGAFQDRAGTITVADWGSPYIGRVVRLVAECAEGLGAKLGAAGAGWGRAGALAPLERFLSFRTAWRIEVIAECVVGARRLSFVRLPIAPGAGLSALQWDGRGLTWCRLGHVACSEGAILVWPNAGGHVAYIDTPGRLLELEFGRAGAPEADGVAAAFAFMGVSALPQVARALADALPDEGPDLDRFLAAGLAAQEVGTGRPEAARCLAYRIDGDLFAVLVGTDTADAPALSLAHWSESETLRLTLVHANPARPDGTRAWLYHLPCPPTLADAAVCAVHRDGGTGLLRLRGVDEPGAASGLRQLIDFTRADDEILTKLYAPLQRRIGANHLASRPARRSCTDGAAGTGRTAGRAEVAPETVVTVVSCGDLDALTLTLVSLAATLRSEPYRLSIVLHRDDDPDAVAHRVSLYVSIPHHRCRSELILCEPGRPLSATVRLSLLGRGDRVVLLPAGAVVVHPTWWDMLAGEWARRPGVLVGGRDAAPRAGEAALSVVGPSRNGALPDRGRGLRMLAWNEPGLAERLDPGLSSFEGLAAGLVAAATDGAGACAHAALDVILPRTPHPTAQARLDEAVLRAAAPRRPTTVRRLLVRARGAALVLWVLSGPVAEVDLTWIPML